MEHADGRAATLLALRPGLACSLRYTAHVAQIAACK
jgi:hypothetical protein